MQKREEDLDNISLSFAGCGFLGSYHVGVACCMKKYAPQLLEKRLAGTSSGALVACAMINGCSIEDCTKIVLETISESKRHILGPFSPNFHLVRDLRRIMDDLLPVDAHIRSSGHLYVSMTRFPDFKNVLVSDFESREELIQALICSSFIPLYSGVALPEFRGNLYFDGAISNIIPTIDSDTVKICPFAGHSDICPDDQSKNMCLEVLNMSTQVTLKNAQRMTGALLPPSLETAGELCRLGFNDSLRFLLRKGLITCSIHADVVGKCDDCQFCTESVLRAQTDHLPPTISNAFQAAICHFNNDSSVRAKICKIREYLWITMPLIFPCSYAYSACKKILFKLTEC